MSDYYDGLNLKLLQAIPARARNVLELGCANGRLGRRFKEGHPGVRWTGIERQPEAARQAMQVLDRVIERDLDAGDWSDIGGPFDTIVIGDLLEHLRDPLAALSALHDLGTPDATIVCCLPNMAHLSVIERMVAGDISYDDSGLLDRTHLRFLSPASAFKLFLDGGWLPQLHDEYRVEAACDAFSEAVVKAAEALGVPAATARRTLGCYQMILVCTRWPLDALARPAPMQPFSVIVPVTRPRQYELNVACSPGLREIGAEIVPVTGATSAAHAYRAGAARASHAWRMMVHQDVYFPVGTGFLLSRCFGAFEAAGATMLPIGFAGLDAADGALRQVGQVIDRTSLFSHPSSGAAVSIDEFAVALHRDAAVGIDASLGWHLWATDLCLQAAALAGQPVAQVVGVPLFHNSTNDYTLPEAFRDSARRLLEKHARLPRIPTLCGMLERSAGAAAPAAAPRDAAAPLAVRASHATP
jgi:SAM-dependent methyltransferase